jgi:hypothetical protein
MNFLPLAGILFAGCGLIGESIEVWPDVPAPDFNPVAPMMDSPTIALLPGMIRKAANFWDKLMRRKKVMETASDLT